MRGALEKGEHVAPLRIFYKKRVALFLFKIVVTDSLPACGYGVLVDGSIVFA